MRIFLEKRNQAAHFNSELKTVVDSGRTETHLLTCQVKIKPNKIVSKIFFSFQQSSCGHLSSC